MQYVLLLYGKTIERGFRAFGPYDDSMKAEQDGTGQLDKNLAGDIQIHELRPPSSLEKK